ncbi:hypothetical protein, partial [Mesorhizobium sp. M8A.F.Ca.ET.213.01.1.1]|uniref:hypothetical protein n=1 Tax=Mesorhizobium sp. M8A.F.Ca.ET.213.01.1.1 TaxID=2563970 RepID=UPI001AEF1626
ALFIEVAHAAFVADAEAFKGKGDIVQFATKRFSSVLRAAPSGRRSRHSATGASIRVPKSRPVRRPAGFVIDGAGSGKNISESLRATERAKRRKEQRVGIG